MGHCTEGESDASPAVKGRPVSIARCVSQLSLNTIPEMINLWGEKLFFDSGFWRVWAMVISLLLWSYVKTVHPGGKTWASKLFTVWQQGGQEGKRKGPSTLWRACLSYLTSPHQAALPKCSGKQAFSTWPLGMSPDPDCGSPLQSTSLLLSISRLSNVFVFINFLY